MRVNRFLLPLMASSVVSAPIPESEPKHQLEARAFPEVAGVAVGALCVACLTATYAIKTYRIGQKTYELAEEKFRTVEKPQAEQAMKIALQGAEQLAGAAMFENLKKSYDMKTASITKNIKAIRKADPKNKWTAQAELEVAKLELDFSNGIQKGAQSYPLDLSIIKASDAYCTALTAIVQKSIDIMASLPGSQPSSPTGSPAGSSNVSPGGSRRNSLSGSGPGSPSAKDRTGSVASGVSGGSGDSGLSAGAASLSLAEKGKGKGVQAIPLTSLKSVNSNANTAAASGSNVQGQAPGPNSLTRRPTGGSVKSAPTTQTTQGKGVPQRKNSLPNTGSKVKRNMATAPSIRRRLVQRVDFDV